jgi:hypothetical protein
MKKILFVYLFWCLGYSLFTQNLDYGLSQQDLNLLLGQFLPNAGTSGRWVDYTFSWGRQRVVDTNGSVIQMDYYPNIASRSGVKYEKYLMIIDSELPFLITKIDKVGSTKFVLSLVLVANPGSPKDAGQITITFLDNIHIVIDNTQCPVEGCFNYVMLWKSAGPTVTVRSKKGFLELPDFEE